MKWAWKLTRLAGIDIYVHATFFISNSTVTGPTGPIFGVLFL